MLNEDIFFQTSTFLSIANCSCSSGAGELTFGGDNSVVTTPGDIAANLITREASKSLARNVGLWRTSQAVHETKATVDVLL